MSKFPLFLAAALLLLGCTHTDRVTVYGAETVHFSVEIADSGLEKLKGLMFRKELGRHRGMLFVYEEQAVRCFWMKNTRIPLDIIFINEKKTVGNIEEADPCNSSPCKRYCSKDRVRYVLEINQGLSKEYGFGKGTRVVLDRKPTPP